MVCTLWRGILGAFFTESYPTFLAPHPVNYAFAIVANATTVLSLMAVLLAHRDEAARELERLATVDGLTGVLNRNAWMSRAATEMAVSVRYGHPVAVLMIDLDHFKQINDTRGHDAGDRTLVFIARALQAAVRPGDLVGRYGGEEFCVLMNHADNAAAGAFDARMRGTWPRSPSTSSAFRSPTAPASPCAPRPTTRSRRCSGVPTRRSTAPRRRAARARSTLRDCACGRRERGAAAAPSAPHAKRLERGIDPPAAAHAVHARKRDRIGSGIGGQDRVEGLDDAARPDRHGAPTIRVADGAWRRHGSAGPLAVGDRDHERRARDGQRESTQRPGARHVRDRHGRRRRKARCRRGRARSQGRA